MRQQIRQSLIKPCRLSGTKPLYGPLLIFIDWARRNKIRWNFNKKSPILVEEDVLRICHPFVSVSVCRYLFLHWYVPMYITITLTSWWPRWLLKSPASRLFTQPFIQSSASLAFVWGIHRDRWIPRKKGQLRGKCFHLMTSSWKKIGIINKTGNILLCGFLKHVIRSRRVLNQLYMSCWHRIIKWHCRNDSV